ncbi:von Willebrand factor type A domain-containing protein, partial [Sphaerospermopsis aphanizomenoides BCCUSP55]|uniref:VWA domain-containing protein n=1 Tax=Sphaerospermopsis aphanizomenoides TaxID=459663 RepID=UPI001907573B
MAKSKAPEPIPQVLPEEALKVAETSKPAGPAAPLAADEQFMTTAVATAATPGAAPNVRAREQDASGNAAAGLAGTMSLREVSSGWERPVRQFKGSAGESAQARGVARTAMAVADPGDGGRVTRTFNTETYDAITENPFLEASANPLSTFSIDVD